MALPCPLPGPPPHPSQAPGSPTKSEKQRKQNGKLICFFAALPAAESVLSLPTLSQEQGVKEFVVS